MINIQNSKFKIQNLGNNGFTLLELTVAIAIVSIMSAVVIFQYNGYRDSRALVLGETQVINDIRMAQGRTYNTLKDNGSFPEGGYGIKFTKNSTKYTIFADSNNDGAHNGDEDSENDGDEDFEIVELPENVKISDLKKDIDTVISSPASVDVIFQPPYGKVLIDGSEKTGGGNFIKLEIEIENLNGDVKTVEISSSRLIK